MYSMSSNSIGGNIVGIVHIDLYLYLYLYLYYKKTKDNGGKRDI
jgi:hypothetical protein